MNPERPEESNKHGILINLPPVVIARGEQMAEEAAGDKEDDAGCSAEGRVQEPELRSGHFL